jgi:hypothetical protein
VAVYPNTRRPEMAIEDIYNAVMEYDEEAVAELARRHR